MLPKDICAKLRLLPFIEIWIQEDQWMVMVMNGGPPPHICSDIALSFLACWSWRGVTPVPLKGRLWENSRHTLWKEVVFGVKGMWAWPVATPSRSRWVAENENMDGRKHLSKFSMYFGLRDLPAICTEIQSVTFRENVLTWILWHFPQTEGSRSCHRLSPVDKKAY